MSINITLTDLAGAPLDAGIDLELLGDGTSVARARTTEGGKAVFDLDPDRYARLAVRLDADPPR
ncbi:MAG: hypothetical protein HC909_00315 [Blastochloris sp.]|nr:hypothetical protein [Blastochloris sp.]